MSDLIFTPQAEEALSDLLAEGEAAFYVLRAKPSISAQTGNKMISLALKVKDINGKIGFLNDFLVMDDTNYSQRKIRHYCQSTNQLHLYERGFLNARDCHGNKGVLLVFNKPQKDGTVQSTVKDYIANPAVTPLSVPEIENVAF